MGLYRRGLGGSFQPFFRWFSCPHIYPTAFFLNTKVDHSIVRQDPVSMKIVIPHEKNHMISSSQAFNLRGAIFLAKKCQQHIFMKQLSFARRHETPNSKQSRRSKVTITIDIKRKDFKLPEYQQLLNFKWVSFSPTSN